MNGIRNAIITASLVGLCLVATAVASEMTHSPYAGQQSREITSLSADDIAQIEAGAGWGLAKPAELNGFPGPRHVLDLAAPLGLTDEQKLAIEAIFERMNTAARRQGAQLLITERALDAAFRSGEIDQQTLETRLSAAEAARAKLRGIHLVAHLETTPLLSAHQRHRYQTLRGYTGNGAADQHMHMKHAH